MLKKLAGIITFLFLVLGLNSLLYPKIIIFPIDYPTISECLEASSAGDIVYVLPGRYKEAFSLPDGISLIGTNTNNTTVWWEKTDYPVISPGNHTLISGFTIEGGWFGIEIWELEDVEIKGNIIKEAEAGVFPINSKNIKILNNIITTCSKVNGHGIPGVNSEMYIKNNIIFNCDMGICASSDLYVEYNTIAYNGEVGVWGGNNLKILNNIISDNYGYLDGYWGWGIVTDDSKSTLLEHNDIWQGNPLKGDLYVGAYEGVLPLDLTINISKDPKFINPEEGNFHLKETSPCLTESSDGGEIGAYGNGGTPGVGIKLSLLQQIEIILRVMDYIPEGSFKYPRYKAILTNKLKVIDRNLQTAENLAIPANIYRSALYIINNIILPRTDGCESLGYPDENDWIIDCKYQEWISSLLFNLIETIKKN